MVKEKKSEKVWKYLLENQIATAKEVSVGTGVSYGYVSQLMRKIGTPKEVRMMCEEPDGDLPSYSRQDILTEAGNLIDGDRHEEYGEAIDNFILIAAYWNAHLGLRNFITVNDVPMMMALMKVARTHGDGRKSRDTFVDICGYAALAGEINEEL